MTLEEMERLGCPSEVLSSIKSFTLNKKELTKIEISAGALAYPDNINWKEVRRQAMDIANKRFG